MDVACTFHLLRKRSVFHRPEYPSAILAALCFVLAFVVPHHVLSFQVEDTYFALSRRTSLELAAILFLMGAVAYKLIQFLGSEPKLMLTLVHFVLTLAGTIALLTLHSLNWFGITEYILWIAGVFAAGLLVLIVNLGLSLVSK